jgi:poly(3-hydroxybutyrate) depolymerase
MMSSVYRSALGCSALSALLLALVPLSACSDSAGPTTEDGAEVSQFPNAPNNPAGAAGSGAAAPGVEPGNTASTPNGEGTPQVEGLAPPAVDGSGQTTPAELPATTPPTDMPPTDIPAETPTTPAGEQNNPTPITPSAGCGKGAPPTGQLSLTIRGNRADYLVTLPPNYSTTTPSPLIFGFHGRNRTFLEFQQVDASQIQTTMGARAVMVYPQSQGGPGWNFDAEVPPSVEVFDALYSQLTENYCVDTSHVFAVGHSSGGYFSDILACRYGDRLRGIGDVSGAIQERACNGNVAALLVHGPNDSVVPFAGAVAMRDFYVERNGCTQTTMPGPVSPCVTYQGCQAGLPVAFCQHDEPTYSDGNGPTNHGWPSFASQAITNFLFALP